MALTEEQNDLLKKMVKFVKEWESDDPEYNGLIRDKYLVEFVTELQEKIYNDISMNGKNGQTLLLYTGKSVEKNNDIWKEMDSFCENNPEYYYISNTDAGSILWEKEFQQAIKDAIGDKTISTQLLSGKEWNATTNTVGERMGPYAIEGTELLALDDFISSTLTQKAIENGNRVVYVAGQGWKSSSVGMQTEIPTFIQDAWIGKDIDEALNIKLTIVSDFSKITDIDSQIISDVDLRKTEFCVDAEGKVIGVKLVSGLDDINVGTFDDTGIIVTYSEKVGILSEMETIEKYNLPKDIDPKCVEAFMRHDYYEANGAKDITIKNNGILSLDDLVTKHPFLQDAKATDMNAYRAKEYLTSIGASDDMIKKLGFDTDAELKAKYDFLSECKDAAILDEFRNVEYAKANSIESEIIANISKENIYLDADGKIIAIGEVGDVDAVNKAKYTIDIESTRNYLDISEVKAKYGVNAELTSLERIILQDMDARVRTGSTSIISVDDLLAKHSFLNDASTTDVNTYRAYEYLKSIGAGDDTIRKLGLYADSDIKVKYGFLADCADQTILDEFRNYEYAKVKGIDTDAVKVMSNKNIFLDGYGKVVALGEVTSAEVASKSVYSITIGDAREFLLDATMESTYKGYNDLTPLEKIQVKQCDYDYRKLNLSLDKMTISDATMGKYLSASGKTADKLNNVDRIFMKIADGITGGNDDLANDLTKLADRYRLLGKGGKAILGTVDFVGTGVLFINAFTRANAYFESGMYTEGEGIIAGLITEAGGGALIGGAINHAISPYFIGLGAALGGPVGAAIGGFVSGYLIYSKTGEYAQKAGQFITEYWPEIKQSFADVIMDAGEELDNMCGGIIALIDKDADGAYFRGTKKDDELNGGDGDSKMEGFEGDDEIYGYGGSDEIHGGDGNDYISGMSGNDLIYGDDGNDTLRGGAGADIMYGGEGYDTFIWGSGYGNDVIYDSKDLSTIRLTDLYTKDLRVWYTSDGAARLINVNTDEVLTLCNFTIDSRYNNFQLEFPDGTTIAVDDPESPFVCRVIGNNADNVVESFFDNSTLNGLAGNDHLIGVRGNDTMYGGKGDDYLEGKDGDDTLNGGRGNDHLEGGRGNDTYVFVAGDGLDTMKDTEGTNKIEFNTSTPDDIIVTTYEDNDALLYLHSNQDMLLIEDLRKIEGEDLKLQFKDGIEMNANDINSPFLKVHGSNEGDTFSTFFANGEAYGYDGNDSIHGVNGKDSIYGHQGNDHLSGDGGNDMLDGGDGDDTLEGGIDDDKLIGGYGNDTLIGGEDADYYYFDLGWGSDIIDDGDLHVQNYGDKLIFGEGISPDDIFMLREDNELYILNIKTGDKIHVKGAFNYAIGYNMINGAKFADGTNWTMYEIENKVRIGGYNGTEEDDTIGGRERIYGYSDSEIIRGFAGNDTLRGFDGDDELQGGDGDDYLYGGNDDDVLVGGAGNDRMEGNYGADTYYFDLGWGKDVIFNEDTSVSRVNDRIVFGEGISPDDILLTRMGIDLVITHTVTGNTITVTSAYSYGDGRRMLDNIEFFDGTKWGINDVQAKTREGSLKGTDGHDKFMGYDKSYGYSEDEEFCGYAGNDTLNGREGSDELYGGEGDDTINGGDGDDYLVGGTGNDRMEGYYGADTYYFELGWGDDIIDNEDTTESRLHDKIVFGEGINPEDILLARMGTNFIITHRVTGDIIRVTSAYSYGDGRRMLDNIEFADGTKWGIEDIKAKTRIDGLNGTDSSENISGYDESYGYTSNEILRGYAGNDTLRGYVGSDELYGGEGNDSIYGGNDNDYIVGEAGNDTLSGESGADTYYFELGWGQDTINNKDTSESRLQDKIVFGEGINPEDILLTRIGSNLVITHMITGDKINVTNAYYYSDGTYMLDNIEFADGTKWGLEDIKAKTRIDGLNGADSGDNISGYEESYGYTSSEIMHGYAGNDTLRGYAGSDELHGGEGNDYLYGGSDNDYIVGGTGNDRMEGESGTDTYYFELGWGNDIIDNEDTTESRLQDKIVFGEGISVEDIVFTRKNRDMLIINTKTGDTIKLLDAYYHTDGRCMIDNIEFADGTKWGLEDIKAKTRTDGLNGTDSGDNISGYEESYGYTSNEILRGYAGNDTLRGYAGSDELYGGEGNDSIYGGNDNDYIVGEAGNDTLLGESGADTYLFELGWGQDTIDNTDTGEERVLDKIVFGEGITPENIVLTKSGNSMLITNILTSDSIFIRNAYYYNDGRCQINNLEFHDGTKAIIDYENVSLTITFVPEVISEENTSVDTLSDETAAVLGDICATDSITDVTTTNTEETNALSAVATETADNQSDVQALLLAQELAGSTNDNNVFNNDTDTSASEEKVFTEQYTIV
ncbi:MAG: hypothetical protein J6L69_07705 [Lachnospiraceae bacterium]|nr:hypothetical protein [Lachnospiraceae bacterium]